MKYRHHGYRDDDYRKERAPKEKREKRGPREITTREATLVMRCWECGNQQSPDEGIDIESTCSNCSADLHCCRNCLHFDPGARFECRQPIDKAFRDKTVRSNCTLFEARPVLDATGRRATGGPGLRSRDGASPTASVDSDGKDAFDRLFK